MLTPVDLVHVCKEQVEIRFVREIPLIESKIVIGFDKPIRRPLADVRVGIGSVTGCLLYTSDAADE